MCSYISKKFHGFSGICGVCAWIGNGRVVSFSSMIIGLTTSVYMTKRKILQRPTLKIWHEKRLEAIASGQEQSNIIDQVAAGYFCCLIFARARFLDGQNSGDFVLDLVCGTIPLKSYIEAFVQGSKTSFTIECEIRYLPTVAQVIDITDYSWALGWIKAMKKFGLKYGKELPLLPIPFIAGNWDILPISAEATTKWIRKVLLDTPDLDPEEIEYIKILDTRSCKTTILSWVAKTYRWEKSWGITPWANKILSSFMEETIFTGIEGDLRDWEDDCIRQFFPWPD